MLERNYRSTEKTQESSRAIMAPGEKVLPILQGEESDTTDKTDQSAVGEDLRSGTGANGSTGR